MRFVILGAGGQLGRDLAPRLDGEVACLTREQADLTRPESLRSALSDVRPQVVINCAAYNLVDKAESEPETAFAVNALGVRQLALLCRALDCTLVHFSSDYVFGLDEAHWAPYSETDAPGPISVYGQSKLTGEDFVRAICPRHLLIRTCGLYGVWGGGGKGGNFVETMLRLAGQRRPIRVVDDQVCTPSYTADVATAAAALVASGRLGLYHLTSGGYCSWFEFARTIFELSNLKVDLSPISSEDYKAAARRPRFSVLANTAYERLGLPPLRAWQQALAAYLRERTRKQPLIPKLHPGA